MKISNRGGPVLDLVAISVVFLGWLRIPGNYFLLEPVLFFSISIFCILILLANQVSVSRRGFLLYFLFASWIVFSDSMSGEFLPALARDTHWLVLPLIAILSTAVFQKSHEMLKAIQAGAALSLVIICYQLYEVADLVIDWVRVPIFGNIRRLAMTVGIFTVILYWDAGYSRAEKWFITLARIIGLSLLFWSGGRGAIMGWAIAFSLFVCCFDQSKLYRWLVEILLAILLSIMLDVGNPSMGLLGLITRTLSATTEPQHVMDAVSSGRMTLWLSTVNVLSDPHVALLGAGGNGFVRLKLMSGQVFHPHNIILQVLTDWGIVGLILLLRLVAYKISVIAYSKLFENQAAGIGISSIVFLLVVGLLDGGLYHPEYLYIFAIALGLIPERQSVPNRAAVVEIPPVAIYMLFGAAMLLHLLLWNYRVLWK